MIQFCNSYFHALTRCIKNKGYSKQCIMKSPTFNIRQFTLHRYDLFSILTHLSFSRFTSHKKGSCEVNQTSHPKKWASVHMKEMHIRMQLSMSKLGIERMDIRKKIYSTNSTEVKSNIISRALSYDESTHPSR